MALPLPLADSGSSGRTLVTEFNRLQYCVPSPDGTAPGLIVVLPPAWANKYQLLLYTAAARHRHAVVGVRGPADLEHISWPGPITLHAHWFASIFDGALNETDALSRLSKAQEQIETFRSRTGARLLWTAHNVFPHGNAFPETYLALRRWIFDSFDLLHVMDETHVPLLETAYDRAAPSVITVPHMTYVGTILDSVDPVTARAHFGLPHNSFVFSFFGSLQDYKNLPRLLADFERICQENQRPLALLVGGMPVDLDCARDLQQRWGHAPNVTLLTRKIEDHEIQYLHRAADVMVLPYAETLNSGAAMMAASFCKPFILPAAASDLAPIGAIGFNREAPDGLRQAMQACLDAPLPVPDPACLAILAPPQISQRFFEAITASEIANSDGNNTHGE